MSGQLRSYYVYAVAAALLGVIASTQMTSADVCETKRGSGVFTETNCNKSDEPEAREQRPNPKQTEQPTKPKESLREELKRRFKEEIVREEAVKKSAERLREKLQAAHEAAKSTVEQSLEPGDVDERQRLAKKYKSAIANLSRLYDEAARASPAGKDEINALKRKELLYFEEMARRAGLLDLPPAETAKQALRKDDPNLFVTCDDPDGKGLQTCYEVPRKGLACVRMLLQRGDRLSTDRQATCESTAVLEARNAHFASKPDSKIGSNPSTGRPADIEAISSSCKNHLNNLLEGADRRDASKATLAYGSLRTDCDAAIRKLTDRASIRLPERRLSSRARRALDAAMQENPDRVIANLVEGRREQPSREQPSYDATEVIETGLALAQVLSGLPGFYSRSGAAGAASRSTAPIGISKTYGQGGPSLPQARPRHAPSDITGTGK